MQASPRTRPGQQARSGDVTGRKREELAREHSEEVAKREGEIAMITAERSRSVSEDVIDPLTREVINAETGTVTRMDAEEDDKPRLIGVGNNAIEEIPDKNAASKGPVSRTQEYLNEKVIIRVNADLEEVTLGYGNVVSFVEGRRYRVPRWVAEHLDEKGLVWH